MQIWIDHHQRRSESAQADQLLSGFRSRSTLLGCPDFTSGATQPAAALQLWSIASLPGRQPGKNPTAPEDRKAQSYQSASRIKSKEVKGKGLKDLNEQKRQESKKLQEQGKTQNTIETQNITKPMRVGELDARVLTMVAKQGA